MFPNWQRQPVGLWLRGNLFAVALRLPEWVTGYKRADVQERYLAKIAALLAVRSSPEEREALLVEAECLEPVLRMAAGTVRRRLAS